MTKHDTISATLATNTTVTTTTGLTDYIFYYGLCYQNGQITQLPLLPYRRHHLPLTPRMQMTLSFARAHSHTASRATRPLAHGVCPAARFPGPLQRRRSKRRERADYSSRQPLDNLFNSSAVPSSLAWLQRGVCWKNCWNVWDKPTDSFGVRPMYLFICF